MVRSSSTETRKMLRRPDTVKWIDNDRLVIANEGDLDGGSRGFTIFTKDGKVAYESGASFEYEVAKAGHYPEARNKKGVEPEGAEVATFGEDRLIFVASERGSVVGVYGYRRRAAVPAIAALRYRPGRPCRDPVAQSLRHR
jgi:hypothetical protein